MVNWHDLRLKHKYAEFCSFCGSFSNLISWNFRKLSLDEPLWFGRSANLIQPPRRAQETLQHCLTCFLRKFLKKNTQISAVKSINRDWDYIEIFWLQILGSWQIWTQCVKSLRNIRHYECLFIRRNIWETRSNVCYWCFNVIFLSYMKKRRWEKLFHSSFFWVDNFLL